MKPIKSRLVGFKRNVLLCRVPRSRTFMLTACNNDRFVTASSSSTGGLKLNRQESPVRLLSSPLISKLDQIDMESNHEFQRVLDMLRDYDPLTINLTLEDPVILESTTQLIIEYSQSILDSYEEECLLVYLTNKGHKRELKLLVHILCQLYKKNDPVKVITLNLLMKLMFNKVNSLYNNREMIKYFINSLFNYNSLLALHLEESAKSSLLKLEENNINSATYLLQYSFFKLIIMCSLLSQNPLLASSLYIRTISERRSQNTNFINYIILNNELLHSIVNSLLVLDPKNDVRNILAIVKLYLFQNKELNEVSHLWHDSESIDLEQFKFKLNLTQQNKLLSNALILDDRLYLSLKIYIFEKILNQQHHDLKEDTNQLAIYLRYSYQLIESNLQLNNDALVYFIWSEIEKYHTILYNAQINTPNNNEDNSYYYYRVLAKLIKFFSKNKRYKSLVSQLIETIPVQACSVNPELMDALLVHATRNGDRALSDILIQQLGNEEHLFGRNFKYITHLTRGQLSALLGLHLKFHDSEGVEKIVNLIYERFPNGLDHVEMNMICKQMLNMKEESDSLQFDKVWRMYESLDPYLGKSLAILIIDNMIENRRLDFDKVEKIFNKLIGNIKPSDEVWEWISSLYIKHLLRNFPLPYAKKVFENSSQKLVYYDRLSNPFSKSFDKAVIYLPYKIKKLILKSILDTSVFHKKNENITFWCLEELEKLGYGYKETMVDLSMSNQKLLLKSNLSFDLLKKTNKQNEILSDPEFTEEDRKLSPLLEKDMEMLYLKYLSNKKGRL